MRTSVWQVKSGPNRTMMQTQVLDDWFVTAANHHQMYSNSCLIQYSWFPWWLQKYNAKLITWLFSSPQSYSFVSLLSWQTSHLTALVLLFVFRQKALLRHMPSVGRRICDPKKKNLHASQNLCVRSKDQKTYWKYFTTANVPKFKSGKQILDVWCHITMFHICCFLWKDSNKMCTVLLSYHLKIVSTDPFSVHLLIVEKIDSG